MTSKGAWDKPLFPKLASTNPDTKSQQKNQLPIQEGNRNLLGPDVSKPRVFPKEEPQQLRGAPSQAVVKGAWTNPPPQRNKREITEERKHINELSKAVQSKPRPIQRPQQLPDVTSAARKQHRAPIQRPQTHQNVFKVEKQEQRPPSSTHSRLKDPVDHERVTPSSTGSPVHKNEKRMEESIQPLDQTPHQMENLTRTFLTSPNPQSSTTSQHLLPMSLETYTSLTLTEPIDISEETTKTTVMTAMISQKEGITNSKNTTTSSTMTTMMTTEENNFLTTTTTQVSILDEHCQTLTTITTTQSYSFRESEVPQLIPSLKDVETHNSDVTQNTTTSKTAIDLAQTYVNQFDLDSGKKDDEEIPVQNNSKHPSFHEELFHCEIEFDKTESTKYNSPAEEVDDVVNVREQNFTKIEEENTIMKAKTSDFDVLKEIGTGAFGRVILVNQKSTREKLAMKILEKNKIIERKNQRYIMGERDILTKIRHPFIVTLKFALQTSTHLFLVMEYLGGGELLNQIRKEGLLNESQASFYAGEIILALDCLHSHNIVHRDLKPENILLDFEGHIRVTDFGLAAQPSNMDECGLKSICGTDLYMAPEMLAGKLYGKAVDFWSLGCILFEMITGDPPFDANNRKRLYSMIMTKNPKFPSYMSSKCIKLLKGLLDRNVERRLGAALSNMFETRGIYELKNHAFFDKLDWDALIAKALVPPLKPHHLDNDGAVNNVFSEFERHSSFNSEEDGHSNDFAGFSYVNPKYQG